MLSWILRISLVAASFSALLPCCRQLHEEVLCRPLLPSSARYKLLGSAHFPPWPLILAVSTQVLVLG